MVLDASLLNTQHYKVRIKGKVEQSRKGVAPSPTPWCSKLSKREPSGHPRLWLPTLLLLYVIYSLSIAVKWFQVLLINGCKSIYRGLLSNRDNLYTYLCISNNNNYYYREWLNNSICPIDENLTYTTSLGLETHSQKQFCFILMTIKVLVFSTWLTFNQCLLALIKRGGCLFTTKQ